MRLAYGSLCLCVTACLTPGPEVEAPSGPRPPPAVTPPPPPSPPSPTEGAFHLTTELSLTPELVFPTPAAELVASLRSFSTQPAHTLLSLAEDAGVPAVGELRAVLPDALESRLEGWIDAEIAKVEVGGVPVTRLAGDAAALAETTLTAVAVHSVLERAPGAAVASHRLVGLDFSPAGLEQHVGFGALPGQVLEATAPISFAEGRVSIGAHSFSLRYGEHAWAAVEGAFSLQTGADVRTTLGAAIDCPAVAATVASKCVLGVCVGHAAQLTEICERGLDEVVDLARDEMTALRLDALALDAGRASVSSEGLAQGTWQAKLNGGLGLRPVPATFAATR